MATDEEIEAAARAIKTTDEFFLMRTCREMATLALTAAERVRAADRPNDTISRVASVVAALIVENGERIGKAITDSHKGSD